MTDKNNQNSTSTPPEKKIKWEIANAPMNQEWIGQPNTLNSWQSAAICCGSFLQESKPTTMTEQDIKTIITSLQHNLRMCSPDRYSSINRINKYVDTNKTILQQDIPLVVLILNEVRGRYMKNIWQADEQNLQGKEELIPIYRLRISEIEIVLQKL